MFSAALVSVSLLRGASGWVVGGHSPLHVPRPAASALRASASAAVPSDYADAEVRGFELYRAGDYDRAIRMFELAQTLPGAGVDYKRETNSGMIGSATSPPNPRGMKLERYATAAQKLIAQYNIACCCAAMGDSARALEILRGYLKQMVEPLDAVNEMLVDDDLRAVRDGLLVLREDLKGPRKS